MIAAAGQLACICNLFLNLNPPSNVLPSVLKDGSGVQTLSQPPEEWRPSGPPPSELHESQLSGEALCAAGLHLPSIPPCWQPTDQIANPRASWHERACLGTTEQRSLLKLFIWLKTEWHLARSASLASLCRPHLDQSVKLKCIAFNCKQKKMDGTTMEY